MGLIKLVVGLKRVFDDRQNESVIKKTKSVNAKLFIEEKRAEQVSAEVKATTAEAEKTKELANLILAKVGQGDKGNGNKSRR